MNRILKRLGIYALQRSGYSHYAADALYTRWVKDFFEEKSIPLAKKLWAYQRGFFPDRISYYGLTDANYRDYLSDFDFARLHPINGQYNAWLDDKLTIKYLLHPFSQYLPGYYYHLYSGEVLRLADCPDGCEGSIPGVINLLMEKGTLAVKRSTGTLGSGFHKLACEKGAFSINKQPASREDIEALLTKWLETENQEHLVTDYLQAHSDLRKYWEETPGTLRLNVIRAGNQPPVIQSGFKLFATKKTGISNVPGGVFCDVDFCTGFFSNGRSKGKNGWVERRYHPDSKVLLEGILPNWDLIAAKIIEISSSIPQIRYMGYDLVITQEGFKIIEINSHSGIMAQQSSQPFMAGGISKDFFTGLLQEKKIKRG
jgi:hypothetical protein